MGAVAAAGPIISGGLSVFGGIKKRQSLKEQALAAEYEARSFDLRAKQVAADRQAELRDAFASIAVARSGAGLSLDSPTAQAIENRARRKSNSAEFREVLGERQAAFSKRNEAKQLRQAGNMALISGLAQGISSASSSSLFKKKSGG